MKKHHKIIFLYTIIAIFFFVACTENNPMPKPRAYFRVDFPEKTYQDFDTNYPYSFAYPTYAKIVKDTDANTEPYWINIKMPSYKATIHISYKTVENNIDTFIEDSHELAYKHVIKADAINEINYIDEDAKVYCTLYSIEGNAATPMQFHITDSTQHFLRGSLYFNVPPNKDSLAPSIDYLTKDVINIMETFKWND